MKSIIVTVGLIFGGASSAFGVMSCDEAIHRGNNITVQIENWNQNPSQDIPFVALDRMTLECYGHQDWSDDDDNRDRILSIAGNPRRHFLNLMKIIDQRHVIRGPLNETGCTSRPDARQMQERFASVFLETARIINDKAVLVADSLLAQPDPAFVQLSHSTLAALAVGWQLCSLYGGACPILENKIKEAKKRQVQWYLDEIRLRHNYTVTPQVLSRVIKESMLLGMTDFDEEDVEKAWVFDISVASKFIMTKPKEKITIDWSHQGTMGLEWVTPMAPGDPGFRFTFARQEINFLDIPIFGQHTQPCVTSSLTNRAFKTLLNLKPDMCSRVTPGIVWAATNLGPHSTFQEDEVWNFVDTCEPFDADQQVRVPMSQTLSFPILMNQGQNPYLYSEEEGRPLITLLIPLQNGQRALLNHVVGGPYGPEVDSRVRLSITHRPR